MIILFRKPLVTSLPSIKIPFSFLWLSLLFYSCTSDISPFFKSIYYQLIKIDLVLFKINCNKTLNPATMCSIFQKEENNDNKMAKPFSNKPI